MSIPTRNPVRMAGAVVQSGAPNLGDTRWTDGGDNVFARLSGVGAATLIVSGPGRLNTVTQTSFASGAAVLFFDGNVATSGAPFETSGHRTLDVIPPVYIGATSISGLAFINHLPRKPQMAFVNGLIVTPVASGSPGFTCGYGIEQSGVGGLLGQAPAGG